MAWRRGRRYRPNGFWPGRWKVSRVTIRRAIEGLVDEGILDRRRGSGTYLTRPRLSRRLTMTSFTEDMRRQGKVPSARAIEFREHRADHSTARMLRIPVGDRVISFARLRLADGEPMILELSTVTASLVPGLTRQDLESSVVRAAGRSLRDPRRERHVRRDADTARPADRVVARRSRVPTLSPAVNRQLRRPRRVVEAGNAIYRGDAYSLSAHLTPHHTNAKLPLR